MTLPQSRLLITKYRAPALPPGVVVRPRLLGRLAGDRETRLLLVSAPAGFGKSTLLAGWAAKSHTPVAWLSLDAGDADVARFLEYLIAAVDLARPVRSGTAAEVLHARTPLDTDAVLTALVNDLGADPAGMGIVLDDYHMVESDAVHRAVAFLMEHLPPWVRLAIASRADPPLPIARWRGRGALTEVRAADLRFTDAEAGRFLLETMEVDLGSGEVAALTARTEGWAAGLQMAALSLQGRADPAEFVRSFTGSDRFVLDYLIEEVLARLPGPTQSFLLRTSILDRLSGPLCDAVTGDRGAAEELESLERRNAFVEALDDDRTWFRYHRLFADLLRHRLHAELPGLEGELHDRASRWYAAEGQIEAAVGHAIAAGDATRAALLVEQAAEGTLAAGEFTTVLSWIDALPPDSVEQRPLMSALGALAAFYGGRPTDSVHRLLAPAERSGAVPEARGTALALRAVIAAVGGNDASAREQADRALELLPDDRTFLRALARTTAGLTALAAGDVDAAEGAFEETLATAEATENPVLQALAMRRLAIIATLRGDLHQAEARYRRIAGFAREAAGPPSPLAGVGLVGLGSVARERGDLGGAETMVRRGLELTRVVGPPLAIEGVLALARVLRSRGDLRGAAAVIEEAERLARHFDATEDDDRYVAAVAAGLHLAEGDLAGAERWAAGLPAGTGRYYPEEIEAVALARLLVASGRPDGVEPLLRPWAARADDQGRFGSLIEIELLRAVAWDLSGDGRAAGHHLTRALELAAPHGHLQTFLDEGPAVADLLRRCVAAGTVPGYGRSVLAAFAGDAKAAAAAAPLADPLTPAERRVLSLLPGRLTAPEIARELYVAPSTVRSHIKAVYRKLGVSSRRQAVDRARRLGLL